MKFYPRFVFAKFLENPTALRFTQIEKILLRFGFEKISGKGSHFHFTKVGLRDISVPIHNRDCKPFYKKMIAKIIRKNFIKK